jgi:hypothetical protein
MEKMLMRMAAVIVAAGLVLAGCGDTAGGGAPVITVDDTTIDAFAALLGSASGGNNPGNPVPVTASLRLTDANWEAILSAVGNSGKYVALDLSACTRSGAASGKGLRDNGIFDPRSDNSDAVTIVSLILPGAAAGIVEGMGFGGADPLGGAFKTFSNLNSVSGSAIETIGSLAFQNCRSLTSADFPLAKSIESSAFSGCTALKTADFPLVETIGDSAFSNCAFQGVDFPEVTAIGDYAFQFSGLETADFPLAEIIGDSAFKDCTVLKTADFPAATILGDTAFLGCTALETAKFPQAEDIRKAVFRNTGVIPLAITLPRTAPKVTSSDWASDTYQKIVTVWTLSNPEDYDDSWQKNFKTAFGPDADITLQFKALPDPKNP